MLDLKTREDLQRLIDEKLPESLTLDYKASPALNKNSGGRAELVKDVTAFANSAGGQIIYGIPEKKTEFRSHWTTEWIVLKFRQNGSIRSSDQMPHRASKTSALLPFHSMEAVASRMY